MSSFLQQVPAIVGPASIMVTVHYWYRRGRNGHRPPAAAAADRVNRASMFVAVA